MCVTRDKDKSTQILRSALYWWAIWGQTCIKPHILYHWYTVNGLCSALIRYGWFKISKTLDYVTDFQQFDQVCFWSLYHYIAQHYSRTSHGAWKWLLERKKPEISSILSVSDIWNEKWEGCGWQCRRLRAGVMSDRREGGTGGGQTQVGVLTIPWVISQLSMGSSWSAGLSSPFTLSWINNRTTPYTREERQQAPPQHRTQSREKERQRGGELSNMQDMAAFIGGGERREGNDQSTKMKKGK